MSDERRLTLRGREVEHFVPLAVFERCRADTVSEVVTFLRDDIATLRTKPASETMETALAVTESVAFSIERHFDGSGERGEE